MTKSETKDILTAVAVMGNDIGYIKERLDRINGNLEDYPVYKEKVSDLEENMNRVIDYIDDIKKLLGGIKIKVYGVAGLVGGISAFIGIIIGKFM